MENNKEPELQIKKGIKKKRSMGGQQLGYRKHWHVFTVVAKKNKICLQKVFCMFLVLAYIDSEFILN